MTKHVFALFVIVLSCALVFGKVAAQPASAPDWSTAYELLEAVNALRAQWGLASYQPNSALMGIAQDQADYLASIGVSNTHIDAYGRRPFQRALDAGYPVGGDLSLGGYFSENVVGGVGLTAQGAVEIWMGDAPHQNTMLSATLQDAGAGVAVVGNTYYYVLDAGLSTGGTVVAYTPPPYVIRNTPTVSTNTPNPAGAIIHIVQSGDTLGTISIAYDIPLTDLLALNNMTIDSVIFPDQQIIIRPSSTATPTQPTSSPTPRPSSTPWSTSTRTPLLLSPTSTVPVPSGRTSSSDVGVVIGIIALALVAAGILSLLGSRKK